MQSKLNEILELCIEKSRDSNKVFYEFKYSPYLNVVLIVKWMNMSFAGQLAGEVDEVLKYMQNE